MEMKLRHEQVLRGSLWDEIKTCVASMVNGDYGSHLSRIDAVKWINELLNWNQILQMKA